jgi:hypothetical protein
VPKTVHDEFSVRDVDPNAAPSVLFHAVAPTHNVVPTVGLSLEPTQPPLLARYGLQFSDSISTTRNLVTSEDNLSPYEAIGYVRKPVKIVTR